ncbi:TIGR01777 family oxidoreductase [Rubritalea marina]|uniref:TIGR01777 family oxidoreductase n=1 Tax=Rubritalea marina TaxID=361055 RepID=UPI0003A20D9A|nr:TIGR01777 family oxidoreductase [Rubritalea marina]
MKKLGVVGANGYIGEAVAKYFGSLGYEVLHIARAKPSGASGQWARLSRESINGLDVLVNVAGAPIDKRWTQDYKKLMQQSRTGLTTQIHQWISDLEIVDRPKIWINVSAVGIYGDQGKLEITEDSAYAEGFLADLCKHWEDAALREPIEGCRIVVPRIGVVLSKEAKAWKRIQRIFKLGLGGRLASGKQWFPWLALDDLLAAFEFVIDHRELRGAFNLVSHPSVTNSEFTQVLSRVLQRPALLPAPKLAMQLLLGDFADVALASQRVVPQKLIDAGFEFRFDGLEEFIQHIES